MAFPKGSSLLGPVHILDLDKAGYIKPHVDSVKVCLSFTVVCVVYTVFLFFMSFIFLSFQFCGSTITGLSLLSDSIMRLVPENNSAEWLNLLLSRRSLYILRYIIFSHNSQYCE